MLFQLTHPLPDKCYVAVSGGADSMAALHFLLSGTYRARSNRVVGIIHVNHGTGFYADEAQRLVIEVGESYGFSFSDVGEKIGPPPKGRSKEDYWREERYKVFARYNDYPIVTAHHLDDCVEQYIINKMVLFNNNTVIPYFGPCGVVRPFRTWSKESILDYCKKNSIRYLDDPSNMDTKFLRNNIRHNVIPTLLKMNPGLKNQVRKLIVEESN